MPQASCLWCERLLLFNPLFSNSLNSLSSAFENNNSRSRLSLLPPVPQNLSPSLAVLGISPITQIDSFPSTRLPPRSRVSFFGPLPCVLSNGIYLAETQNSWRRLLPQPKSKLSTHLREPCVSAGHFSRNGEEIAEVNDVF